MLGYGRAVIADLAVPALVAALGLAAWLLRVRVRELFERQAIFEVRFEIGGVRWIAGPIPRRIREELLEVAASSGVTGELRYYAPGEYGFVGMDKANEQRFRNVLALTFQIPPTPG